MPFTTPTPSSGHPPERSRWRVLLLAGILLGAAGLFWVLNRQTPYVLDDYYSMYRFTTGKAWMNGSFEDADRIRSVRDAVDSSLTAYHNWGGRLVTGTLVPALLLWEKPVFDVLNALVLAGVLWLLAKHGAGRRKVEPWNLAVIAALFWLAAPAPGLTLFWYSGAVTYLWSALFYLAFLLPYRLELDGEAAPIMRGLLAPLMPILGFLAGCTNENVAPCVVLLAAVALAETARRRRRMPLWGILGLTGGAAGFLTLVLAPGNLNRMQSEGHMGGNLVFKAALQTCYLFQSMPGLLPALAAAALVAWHFPRDAGRPRLHEGAAFTAGGLLAAYAMMASPYLPSRAVFGAFILLLAAFSCLLAQTAWQDVFLRRFRIVLAAGLAAMALFSWLFAYRDLSFTMRLHRERLESARALHAATGQEDFVFRSVHGITRYNALYKTDILSENPAGFVNRHLARKTGVRSLRVAPESACVGMKETVTLPAPAAP